MNVRLLKAKRMERNVLQSEIADVLQITPKSVCEKENSPRCRFTAEEMLTVSKHLQLTLEEFDAIFFDNKLTKSVIAKKQYNQS